MFHLGGWSTVLCIRCPAGVEQSSSLAGLIDAIYRQKMNPASRATATAIFCNSDVEKTFAKQ